MMRCKYWDCGWCYCKTGKSNDINGKCMTPNECHQLASQQQPQQHAAIEDKVMSNEKMREEFEAWFKSFSDIDVLFDDNDQAFAIDPPITYGDKIVNTTVDGAWKSWKSSRAALCVNLPDSERSVDCGDVLYLSDVEQSLDDAGVRHK